MFGVETSYMVGRDPNHERWERGHETPKTFQLPSIDLTFDQLTAGIGKGKQTVRRGVKGLQAGNYSVKVERITRQSFRFNFEPGKMNSWDHSKNATRPDSSDHSTIRKPGR
jgi:hypothetical protein